MNSWTSYPKLFSLGHGAIKELFYDEVIVEEKVDGSQFSFGVFDGVIKCKSKSKEQEPTNTDKMFIEAVKAVEQLAPKLVDGWTYRAEYLQKPKHNVLAYDRFPVNHLILFDVCTGPEVYLDYDSKIKEAERIGLEIVPLLARGKIIDPMQLTALLDTTSILGGQKIEGFVVKNYSRFGIDKKALMGKFVSEEFKEVHKGEWKKEHSTSNTDLVQRLGMKYRTPARWNKAIQRATEQGKLTNSPKDIGMLIAEVQADVLDECCEEIKLDLFNAVWGKLKPELIKGLPQWYKERLMKEQFEVEHVTE